MSETIRPSEDDVRKALEALEYLESMANGHDYADEPRIMAAADTVGYVLHHARDGLT
jgi:hypothetical protein